MAAELEDLKAMWSDLKAQVDELASERQQYLEFFEQSSEAYVVTDNQGTIEAVNLLLGTAKPLAWTMGLQPRDGAAFSAHFSVRPIALKKSGAGGLCWLIRAAD